MTFSDERVFMNTIIRMQVVSEKGTIFTREKIDEAYDCFEHVVNKFSRFARESELSLLNRSAGRAYQVSPELFDLVVKALKIAEITDGAYDPTIIDLLEAYGYDNDQNFERMNQRNLSVEVAKLASDRPSFREISLNVKDHTIKLHLKQRLDLGSIGKGYAIDLAFDVLKKSGCSGFLINAGGDLRAFGNNPSGLPWKVLLFKSQLPNQRIDQQLFLGNMLLENCAVCGSGGWARKVGSFHHLLDPKSGQPINTVAQTYVSGPNATDTDLWATALYVTGVAGLKLVKNAGCAGLIVTAAGEVLQTDNFEYYS